MRTPLNPKVPGVNWNNYEAKCLRTVGAAVNCYLMEGRVALRLELIATEFIDINKLVAGQPLYWYPRDKALEAVIDFHKNALGGMTTSATRAQHIDTSFQTSASLVGANNQGVRERKRTEKDVSRQGN